MSDKLAHALSLARDHSFRVFPLRDNDKRPRVKEWQHNATTDEKQIREWWGKWPNANIGVATGAGLTVLDVDTKNGKPGALSLLELEHTVGVPETLRVKTPSGGTHVYLATDPDLFVPSSTNTFADYPGIDVRGEGGYVVGRGSSIDEQVYR
jgi:hypothetical protein